MTLEPKNIDDLLNGLTAKGFTRKDVKQTFDKFLEGLNEDRTYTVVDYDVESVASRARDRPADIERRHPAHVKGLHFLPLGRWRASLEKELNSIH